MTRPHFFSALLLIFLTGCAAESDLWGNLPTPTAPAAAPLTNALLPTASYTPGPTPLIVLPLPGTPTPGALATLPPVNTAGPMLVILSSGGDTLNIIARRAGVNPVEIISDVVLPAPDQLIPPGTLLLMPNRLPPDIGPEMILLPDSEFVYSASALDFDTAQYVQQSNGYLNQYREYLMSKAWVSGAAAVQNIADDNSLNPRLLLAIIEYESRWVRGSPENFAQSDYPLGYVDYHNRGLFRQMMWAAGQLSLGYYGWRAGTLTEITFLDGSRLRLNPKLNAASVGLMYFFAQLHDRQRWEEAMQQFPALYNEMFGDPWARAAANGPLLPAGLSQPPLDLPFALGAIWSFSGGPHSAWEHEGALAALDFAPASTLGGCVDSDAWVVAPAPGIVVRVDDGVVVLDLDGDGREQTGWNLLFLHIANRDKVALGAHLQKDDHIGHPSCEGGVATGTHLHFARKFNGEWMLADGPLAFNLGGWVSQSGAEPYKGFLRNGEKTIEACACGSFETRISRPK
ncbi:MAG: hypothetical protein Fur0035_07870 [Anaerolineales bacterium]